ncbi:DNA polymerase I [Elizabethkingia sp. JS20170427COW]|uniref:DNA polymerase I n=1 Tax=Elizabethkingia sp. JS20170427COW TaxID=2583851 RepID=UPI001110B0AF|nr:DNA polymerase I [Elizabethkingia sp. JS20170427COW]QCX52398.1 DNA polymerase I [Elizabethkingia sp. JS20170427COW]
MNPSPDKRLFLVDAYAMIFRGYYALIRSPRITSTGMNTSAIFGFTNSLIELIKRERPTHLAVAFDVGGATIRHEEFQEYKANRSETPEAIKIAVPYIHQILKAMGIPILGVEGYEADDVIGTLSHKAESNGYQVFMVTPDKDFAQLVTEQVKIYKPAMRGNDIEILGIEEVKQKYEINNPKQVIDFLAMMGDSVDNIPGLEGVGEKTAIKFLKEYGSIENLLANTHQLKGKLKEKVEASAERGLLSKRLATIITDVPIEFNEKNYALEIPDFESIKSIFEELEFRRLYKTMSKAFSIALPTDTTEVAQETPKAEEVKKVSAVAEQLSLFDMIEEEDTAPSKKDINSQDHLYQVINTEKALKILVGNIMTKNAFCFDIETSTQNDMDAQIIGISLSYKKGLAYYIPFSKDSEKTQNLLSILNPLFENEEQIKIAHNLKFDFKILHHHGLSLKGKLYDTMIAHYLLNPDGRHGLDYLSEMYLHYLPIPIENLVGKKGKNQKNLQDLPLEELCIYVSESADLSYQLYELFTPQLKEQGLIKLFDEVEMPLTKVLAEMELAGISLDAEWLSQESLDLDKDLQQLEQKIYSLSGEEFNLNSPKQLGEILFGKLQLDPKAKKTKTGQYATSEDILQKLTSKHDIIPPILEYRQLQKLKSTYVDALPQEISPIDQRVHTTFSQTTAATGRLASLNPNLQNIPIRTPRGQQIRGAFVAKEDHQLISADYSQIELRLIAEISGEQNMIEAFEHGADIHASTAAKLFKIPIEEVSKTQRSQAKTVNFGIIYGQGAFALAEQTGLSRNEAKAMIDAYYENYPRLGEFMKEQVKKARDLGYVETILGRKRHLVDINSNNFVVRGHAERNAVNAPIQGSAADIIKLAMIRIQEKLHGLHTKMLLQVHDELIFETPKEEVAQVCEIIKTEMESAFPTKVPLTVEVGVGKNWLEAH